jgi:hypothetical protein
MKIAFSLSVVLVGAMLLSPSPLGAVESGVGRYFPGMFAQPGAGIVPPFAGFYFANTSWYYTGSAPRNVLLPRNGRVSAGADADIFWNGFTVLYVPKTEWRSMSIGFAVTVPLQHAQITVYPEGLPITHTDKTTAFSDMIISPVTVGWRKGTHFWSAGLRVFTPSSKYDTSDFATPSTNCWTYSPNFSYTYLNPKKGYDLSISAGLDLNTENKVTQYKSGSVFHLDLAATRTLPSGFGFGGIVGYMQQASDDQGVLADRFGGLHGRGMTVGPMLKYTAKAGSRDINFSLGWAPEFAVKNRTRGNSIFAGVSVKI